MGFAGDTLWVRNRTPPRISRFLGDGTHVGTERVQVDAGYRTTAGVQGVSGYLTDGRARMEPDGFVVAPDGSGILLVGWSQARPDELSIRLISPEGAALGAWTLTVPPVPAPPEVLDSLVQEGRDRVREVRERVIESGVPEAEAPSVPSADEVRAAAYLPDHFPPIRDALLGLDGTIWLHRNEGLAPGAWVALDREGTPLFKARPPEGVRLRQTSREAPWGTMSDDLGVPYVIRWNLVAPDADREEDG